MPNGLDYEKRAARDDKALPATGGPRTFGKLSDNFINYFIIKTTAFDPQGENIKLKPGYYLFWFIFLVWIGFVIFNDSKYDRIKEILKIIVLILYFIPVILLFIYRDKNTELNPKSVAFIILFWPFAFYFNDLSINFKFVRTSN